MTETLGTEQASLDAGRFAFRIKAAAAAPPNLFHFTHPASCPEPTKAQEALPDYGVAYFHQMLAQYWTFPTNDSDPTACIHFNLQAIAVIYGLIIKYKSSRLTWEDLYELETAMIRVMPEAMLRSQTWVLRARFREIVPSAEFRLYRQSKPSASNDATLPTEMLRAEMETLLAEMQKYRTLVPNIAPGRPLSPRLTTPWLGWGALAAAGVSLALHFVPLASGTVLALTLLTVSASGAAGGWVSLQKRLQAVIARKMAFLDKVETMPRQFSPPHAVFAGVFFALLLFFAFRSHALQGIVFPEVSRAALSNPFTFGLLAAWSFGAGFAERLVPEAWNFLEIRFPKA